MSFVIMKGGYHPNAIVIPSPVAVAASRKEANQYIKERQHPHLYYVRKAVNLSKEISNA
jgi:hypothetical protein